MRPKPWLALCLVPALLATSCIYHIGVQVEPGAAAGDPPELAFSRQGKPLPRLDSLTVTGCPDRDVTGPAYVQREHPGLPIVWRIVRDQGTQPAAQAPRITYGRVPAGYRELRPAEPLRPGGCYNLRVAGWGDTPNDHRAFGGETFRVLPDGRLLVGTPGGVLNNPRPFRELNRAAVGCARGYRRARTPADSAAVHARAFGVMDTPLSCGWLRSNWPDAMSTPRSGEYSFLLILSSVASLLLGIYDGMEN